MSILKLLKQQSYQQPRASLLAYFLKWLQWLYSAIIYLHNLVYEYKLKTIHTFHNTIVISIGNIAVGGTGKTPYVEYMLRLLQAHFNIAVVSRGYGRKTTADIIVTSMDSADTVGDEPYQLYLKFAARRQQPVVAVGKNRATIIAKVLQKHPETQLIVLDDAFQHRRIYRDLNILLTTFYNPFFLDNLLPMGTLREHKQAAQRADMVLVTKCPDCLTQKQQTDFCKNITDYTKRQVPIFFTYIRYHQPIGFNTSQAFTPDTSIILLTGIADTRLLVAYVSTTYHLAKHISFNDHHSFTRSDIQKIAHSFWAIAKYKKCILTTEKDGTRLIAPILAAILKDIPIYLLPIAMHAGEQEERLNAELLAVINRNLNLQNK